MPRRKRSAHAPRFSGGKRGRKSRLSTISFADLQNEMRRREGLLQNLMDQRQRINEQLQMIDMEITEQGGQALTTTTTGGLMGRPRRGRPPGSGRAKVMATPMHGRRGRKGSGPGGGGLVESLVKVLTGKEMSVAEMCDAVKRVGYHSSSPNFRTIVNAALGNNRSLFKRIKRGVYTTK